MVTVSRLKPNHGTHSEGFTYLGLLFFIAIMGITLAMAATLWSFARQREAEQELLFIGHQFRKAIGLYYERTPGTVKRYPQKLEDLLQDNRYVTTQRYLRQIYRDPMTGTTEWELVPAPDGGIMGVYSRSEGRTIKAGNFRYEDRGLEGANSYRQWRFSYVSTQMSGNSAKLNR